MKLHHVINVLATSAVAVGTALPSGGKMVDMQSTYREMENIVASTDLTKDEKFTAISAYFQKEPYWPGVFHRLDKVDKAKAEDSALTLFRKPGTSRVHMYQLGHYLLRAQRTNLDGTPNDPPGFITEYRAFLIDAIVDGGQEEFCIPKSYTRTAVGEYAGIAGGIDRPVGILFSDVADKRVIPVLIECLSAPDHVFPTEQGCVVQGDPGQPTGRNTQRQGIPLALMKLNATNAIPALQDIVRKHHDEYLRMNATKALDVLVPLTRKQDQ